MKTAVTIALALTLVALNASSLQAQQPAPSEIISLDSVRSIGQARWPINTGMKTNKLTYISGVPVYGLRIGLKGPGHRELLVNARTGDVLSDEFKADTFGWIGRIFDKSVDKRTYIVEHNIDTAEGNPLDITKAIPQDSARLIARSVVPVGEIKDIHLDRQDGHLIYRIKIETPRGFDEFTLDALTGEALGLKHK